MVSTRLLFLVSRHAGGRSTLVEQVTITADKQMVFTVLLKEGRFVLERSQR